eukprot:CAMPEP_0117451146 /NCGR_PEP_ID=MMETSP0759-20121206/8851_1 /TAXON_ID=63605 /ORGANISM="Percolomonas cosmopolitus, Strain WS" /LENGTH=457 /DNA_ID=CAMNT_0005243725 /DNA_START=81 /DNA_END=1451 /DNA_ORIENTATION=-
MPKKRSKKQKNNSSSSSKRTKKRTAVISEQEVVPVNEDSRKGLLDVAEVESQDPLLLISPVRRQSSSDADSATLSSGAEGTKEMLEQQQQQRPVEEENKENNALNRQMNNLVAAKMPNGSSSALASQRGIFDNDSKETVTTVEESDGPKSTQEGHSDDAGTTRKSVKVTPNDKTPSSSLPSATTEPLPDLTELSQLVALLNHNENKSHSPEFSLLLPQITQLLRDFQQLREKTTKSSSEKESALQTAHDEIIRLQEQSSAKDNQIRELQSKLHHWETEFDEQCREVESKFKKEKNELNILLELERTDSDQFRRTIEQLEDEIQELTQKLNESMSLDTRDNGINTSFQSTHQQQSHGDDQTDNEEEFERMNERIDHLIQEKKDSSMHIEALEQELAKQKTLNQKINMERDVYQKKYLHHAFLSIKLKLNSAEFNAKSIPDLVEEAFESSVRDQDLNMW